MLCCGSATICRKRSGHRSARIRVHDPRKVRPNTAVRPSVRPEAPCTRMRHAMHYGKRFSSDISLAPAESEPTRRRPGAVGVFQRLPVAFLVLRWTRREIHSAGDLRGARVRACRRVIKCSSIPGRSAGLMLRRRLPRAQGRMGFRKELSTSGRAGELLLRASTRSFHSSEPTESMGLETPESSESVEQGLRGLHFVGQFQWERTHSGSLPFLSFF